MSKSRDRKAVAGWIRMFGVFLLMSWTLGCGGKMPEDLGAKGGRLGGCPESPNCVSSFATDEGHQIAPYALAGEASAAWSGLNSLLEARDDVEVIKAEGGYVHAVFTTALMRYRDDVEFLLRANANANEIAVRSASRVGYGDMDANRNRIEEIRAALAADGLVAASVSD